MNIAQKFKINDIYTISVLTCQTRKNSRMGIGKTLNLSCVMTYVMSLIFGLSEGYIDQANNSKSNVVIHRRSRLFKAYS